jgi:TctA family transporter
LKVTVQNVTAETRQLLEDVQANLHDAIAGEAILRSYTEETREKFGVVIGKIMEAQLGRALEISQSKMDLWVTGKLNDS